MKRNRRVLFAATFAISFALSSNAVASREQQLANAAGEYYGAIVFAKEFQKTRCGNISIDKKWTDTERARQEIRAKMSTSSRKELDREWRAFDEAARTGVAQLIRTLNGPKYQSVDCRKVQAVFWDVFSQAVDRWRTF